MSARSRGMHDPHNHKCNACHTVFGHQIGPDTPWHMVRDMHMCPRCGDGPWYTDYEPETDAQVELSELMETTLCVIFFGF